MNECVHQPPRLNEHGVCTACVAAGVGAKADAGKLDLTLLLDMSDALEETARVLAFGARKYARGNYANVPDARERYTAALLRHVNAWWRGERNDPEHGHHHLGSVVCCALFLLALDLRGKLGRPSASNGDGQVK